MTELTITEQDVSSFREKLDAWGATLSDGEQAILHMVAVRAFPEAAGGSGDEVQGYGSASGGAGAGKVSFNPFSITRKVDKASPIFFQMADLNQFEGQHVVIQDAEGLA